jgi:tRNA 2-thiouridine synthesizing protein A
VSAAAITRHLDVTGTFCPLPILLAAREMLRLAAGDRLEIVGDDVAILEDMPVWCERAGHRLVEIAERDGKIVSLVEKGGAPPPARERRGRAAAGRPRPGGGRGGGAAGGNRRPPGRRRPRQALAAAASSASASTAASSSSSVL